MSDSLILMKPLMLPMRERRAKRKQAPERKTIAEQYFRPFTVDDGRRAIIEVALTHGARSRVEVSAALDEYGELPLTPDEWSRIEEMVRQKKG